MASSELGSFAKGIKAASAGDVAIVVTGNEASDADSIVSALVHAFLKQKKTGKNVVPIVMCNREDMPLRKETTLLLEFCGVDWQDLIYGDDGVEPLLEKAGAVILTDHNKATGPVAKHGAKICEIVDHHKDAGDHGHVSGDARRIAFEGEAATAGSACSLVAEAFMAEGAAELLAADSGAAARALLGVILIDTLNLDPAAKKVTPRDTAAAQLCGGHAPSPAAGELFGKLQDAKFDMDFWATLTPAQCFRYDFKAFTESGKTYGLSSCLCSLEMLCSKTGFQEELQRRAAEVHVFGVLTNLKTASGPRKELLLFSDKPGVLDRCVDFMKKYDSPSLDLSDLAVAGAGAAKAFVQGNTGASRKQVAPALGVCMASL